MVQDVAQRMNLRRIDDDHRHGKVLTCRRIIYDNNYGVDCSAVEKLLSQTSLAPNTVCGVNPVQFRRALNARVMAY
jgi:hypothetical protein